MKKDRRNGTADPRPCARYAPRGGPPSDAPRLCGCGWGEFQHDVRVRVEPGPVPVPLGLLGVRFRRALETAAAVLQVTAEAYADAEAERGGLTDAEVEALTDVVHAARTILGTLAEDREAWAALGEVDRG